MCGQSTAYNIYATMPTINPLFMGFSCSQNVNKEGNYVPVFLFGCNKSQYMAVKRAMENRISVIQGPPGTGKIQTILNIIANILLQGKTVQIVSNNNSATENVYDKLASPKLKIIPSLAFLTIIH